MEIKPLLRLSGKITSLIRSWPVNAILQRKQVTEVIIEPQQILLQPENPAYSPNRPKKTKKNTKAWLSMSL